MRMAGCAFRGIGIYCTSQVTARVASRTRGIVGAEGNIVLGRILNRRDS
jgi:hypothetical protein